MSLNGLLSIPSVVLPALLVAVAGVRGQEPDRAELDNIGEIGVEDVAKPEPHWSGLPIWGKEAAERGFVLPKTFGAGVNFYHEEQPFDITDLSVSLGGPPVSVKGFATIDQIDAMQDVVTGRFDAWIFPFLNIYGLVGYTDGEMEGVVGLPGVPLLMIPPQNLPINLAYEGATLGGGITLAGGFELTEWRSLTLFAVIDNNVTRTDLDFKNEAIFTDSEIDAYVFSSRIGLRAKLNDDLFGALWFGAMRQEVTESLVGQSTTGNFAFEVLQEPSEPWNFLIGGRLEAWESVDLVVEGGLGTRESFLVGLSYRF